MRPGSTGRGLAQQVQRLNGHALGTRWFFAWPRWNGGHQPYRQLIPCEPAGCEGQCRLPFLVRDDSVINGAAVCGHRESGGRFDGTGDLHAKRRRRPPEPGERSPPRRPGSTGLRRVPSSGAGEIRAGGCPRTCAAAPEIRLRSPGLDERRCNRPSTGSPSDSSIVNTSIEFAAAAPRIERRRGRSTRTRIVHVRVTARTTPFTATARYTGPASVAATGSSPLTSNGTASALGIERGVHPAEPDVRPSRDVSSTRYSATARPTSSPKRGGLGTW